MNRRQRKLEEKRRRKLERENKFLIGSGGTSFSGWLGEVSRQSDAAYKEHLLKLKAAAQERERREREMLTNPPVFSECVNGYRAWRIDAYGELRPISARSQVWLPGTNTATCVAPELGRGLTLSFRYYDERDAPPPEKRHHAPAYNCDCGLYGWNSPKKHADGVGGTDNTLTPVVTGSIAAWGDLMVHPEGFRAEHACVTSLAIPKNASAKLVDLIDRVADKYGVGVCEIDELEVEASKHGTPLPDDAKPDWNPPAIDENPFAHALYHHSQYNQVLRQSYGAQLLQTLHAPTYTFQKKS